MSEGIDALGEAIETLDNILAASNLPMGDKFHMERFRSILPEISAQLKKAYEEIAGENPWNAGENPWK